MKKHVVMTLALAMVPSLVLAYPAVGGGRGLYRVQNAMVEEEAGLTISLHTFGRHPRIEDADPGWIADLTAPELSYTPIAMKYVGLEVFTSWGGVFQYPKEFYVSPKKFGMGLHDLRAGAKLSIPIIPVLKLGGTASYTFTTGRDTGAYLWVDPNCLPLADDPPYTWTGLATFQFQDVALSAPNLMFNYGKVNKATLYGVGIELAAAGFALFAEARSLQPEASTGLLDIKNGEIRLTPGVAFGTSGLTLKAGYTFSWGPGAPNEAVLGLVIATPFGKRVPPEFGTIAGKVSDARTGEPLEASVAFPENPELASMSTDPSTGVFTIEKVPVGVVIVEVSVEGYHRQAMPINVEADAVSQYEFALKPLVTYGVIAGMVTDATNNQPLEAAIEFPKTDVKPVRSDPGTGAFRIDDVPVGVYTVTASAEEYFKASLTVQGEEGRVASPTFALKPLTMKSTITGKVSDKKTGEPVAAVVSFPGSDVPEVENDPETGVYKTDIPVGSYAMKVSAEGYIAQTAAVVIEESKPTIKDFELIKEGMSITLRGIYFDFNKATIKPESRPALEDAAKIMQDNPTIKVEIQGHTDWIGPDAYNQKLSERRAQSVVTYLVQNFGVGVSRLTGKGYGESKPIASNETDEGRSLNRRVEFFIISAEEE